MRKLVASMAFAAAVLYGVTAKAAPVDVHVAVCADPAGCTIGELGQAPVTISENDLVIFNDHSGLQVGSVSIHLDPAAGDTFTPTGLVSALDSVLSGEFIILIAPAGVPFNGSAGNTGSFLLGNFTGAHFTACDVGTCTAANGLYEDLDNLGPMVLDPLGNPITSDFDIHGPAPVPEPASLVLLGLGAAGLALVRRTA